MTPAIVPRIRSSIVPPNVTSPTAASASVRAPSVSGSARTMIYMTTRDRTPAEIAPAIAPAATATRMGAEARQTACERDTKGTIAGESVEFIVLSPSEDNTRRDPDKLQQSRRLVAVASSLNIDLR